MAEQAETINGLVNKVISDIHLKTMRSSHSFDDIYARLGAYRNLTNVILCIILLIILMCLIIGLCFGSFAKSRRGYRDDCCNKGTGATCLLIAILLIFLTLSIIALIGLFYFVFGLLAYHGACAPLRDTTENGIFNSFDSLIDFHQITPPVKTGFNEDEVTNTENPLPPIRLSTALNACRSNESIIDILQMNQYYSIRNLELLKILKNVSDEAANAKRLDNVFEKLTLLSTDEYGKLEKILHYNNLSLYHSRLYKNEMCTRIPGIPIDVVINGLSDLIDSQGWNGGRWIGYHNLRKHLYYFRDHLHAPLLRRIYKIHNIVERIDRLILRKNLNFNETITELIQDIKDAEKFIKELGAIFINELTANLTAYLVVEIEKYKDYVIDETNFKVGRCHPLAYIYENGVDVVCNRMVHPMNGFWAGVLLCCLLFLPILWVAHKLQCLYKKVGLFVVAPVVIGGCPECTGKPGPIKPATVMVCSGGLGNKKCPCTLIKTNVPNAAKFGDCPCSSEAIKVSSSPVVKTNTNNENRETISEWGDFFDVEAQQRIVFHETSLEFPKKKID